MRIDVLWKGLPGHPLHPPLTDATIGAYTAATVLAFLDVVGASDKAAAHGMDHQGGATIIAELMLQFGDDFERSPVRAWTESILKQPELPGPVKAESLRERYRDLSGGRPVLTF